MNTKHHITYFGSSAFSIYVLDELERASLLPSLIVTTPDKPAGRKLILTPTPVKIWAQKRNIPVLDPAKLDSDFVSQIKSTITSASGHGGANESLFIVASYGNIIPQTVLDIPKHKTLNVHPSLLPKYRGASPLQSAMLDDEKNTGVTIMEMDALMDHGPIVAQTQITIGASDNVFAEWPIYEEFEKHMGVIGGRLLADTIELWLLGTAAANPQDHTLATFTKKIKKEDAEISLVDIKKSLAPDADPKLAYAIFRKIQAYHEWPTAYFFTQKTDTKTNETKKTRIKITGASYTSTSGANGKLTINRIIPEGKPETSWSDVTI